MKKVKEEDGFRAVLYVGYRGACCSLYGVFQRTVRGGRSIRSDYNPYKPISSFRSTWLASDFPVLANLLSFVSSGSLSRRLCKTVLRTTSTHIHTKFESSRDKCTSRPCRHGNNKVGRGASKCTGASRTVDIRKYRAVSTGYWRILAYIGACTLYEVYCIGSSTAAVSSYSIRKLREFHLPPFLGTE